MNHHQKLMQQICLNDMVEQQFPIHHIFETTEYVRQCKEKLINHIFFKEDKNEIENKIEILKYNFKKWEENFKNKESFFEEIRCKYKLSKYEYNRLLESRSSNMTEYIKEDLENLIKFYNRHIKDNTFDAIFD